MTRAEAALRYRIEAAYLENGVPPCHWSNGDEQLYATRINSFAKCLPMNDLGEPRIDAFEALVDALHNGTYEALEQLPLTGGRLKDPLAAHAHPLEGMDGGQGKINPAPAFSSAEAAGELVELYWLSLLRDVNFDQYATHPLAAQAVSDLSRLSDYRGPSLAGGPSHLFRGTVAGCLVGPYVSQFMWKNFSVWNMFVDPKLMQPPVPNQAFSTSWSDWMRMEQCLNHSFQVCIDVV
jgi:hypothetical protein